MSESINELDLVVLLQDTNQLPRGQVGRVVQEMASGLYEVEFSDSDDMGFAFLTLRENQIMKLLFDPPMDIEYED